MVVLGYGIWDDFSDKAVQLRVRRHLAAVQQWGGSTPRLIFLASDARHRSEFIWQNDKHVVIFNGKMVRSLPPTHTHPPTPACPPVAAAAAAAALLAAPRTQTTVAHTLSRRVLPLPLSQHAHAARLGRRPTGVGTRTVTHAAVGRCSSPSTH